MATKKRGLSHGGSSWLRNSVLFACALGICLSAYALYVEVSKERDASYRALCDFSESVSCSRVFTSRWGRGFGLIEYVAGRDSWFNQPNSIFGMAFYAFQSTLAFNPTSVGAVIQLGAAIVANIGSIYLAYILFFILNDVCVVCLSTYAVNFILLICSILKCKQVTQIETRKRR